MAVPVSFKIVTSKPILMQMYPWPSLYSTLHAYHAYQRDSNRRLDFFFSIIERTYIYMGIPNLMMKAHAR